jgi:hypothetical protein
MVKAPQEDDMLCLVRTKGCKRCGGDLSLECDIYGVYATCIQCGATWSKTEMFIHHEPKVATTPKASSARTLVGAASKH